MRGGKKWVPPDWVGGWRSNSLDRRMTAEVKHGEGDGWYRNDGRVN